MKIKIEDVSEFSSISLDPNRVGFFRYSDKSNEHQYENWFSCGWGAIRFRTRLCPT